MAINAPRGTKDVLPDEVYKWQYIESFIRRWTALFGYKEIRTPVFEHTELFQRGVGDTTDIVQKEMYTFVDKGNRSITLKPEGTAGVVRAYIEHKLYAEAQPIKLYYLSPIFRYERPQAGRLREHHQFGVEAFGSYGPSIDAEIVDLAMSLLNNLGLKGLEIHINSIGCKQCRPVYHKVLMDYLADRLDRLCDTCRSRYDKNPLRILDCKEKGCQAVLTDAPDIVDYLCDDCKKHFDSFQDYLSAMGYKYEIDPRIVRGLDYYTRTVFEILSTDERSPGTICGGGRYDDLVEQCGGPSIPGAGFGMGLERLLLCMDSQGIIIPVPKGPDLFIAAVGEQAYHYSIGLASMLRKRDISVEIDHVARSLKGQFKYADKLKAQYVLVIGSDEMASGHVSCKNMSTGQEQRMELDNIAERLHSLLH
ncbi:MAG: histidyl-tRNA synthetase [Clostridiales bacterium]|nr:histidyl-tRNA synthetase [Clostridiales bacterium]